MPAEPRLSPVVRIALGILVIAAAFAALTALGLRSWIGDELFILVSSVVAIIVLGAVLIPVGLALFYVVTLPLLALSEWRGRRQIQQMQLTASAAVGHDEHIVSVWYAEYLDEAYPTPGKDRLVVVTTGPVGVDLEQLRTNIEALRGARWRQIELHEQSPESDDPRAFPHGRVHALFQRAESVAHSATR